MTPMVDLQVIGTQGPVAVTAIIDTGFDGHLCLPTRIAVTLGLVLTSSQMIELADGTQKDELVFSGSVRFLDTTRRVTIFLTNSEDALVGTSLLEDCRLNIDFPSGKVKLTRNNP